MKTPHVAPRPASLAGSRPGAARVWQRGTGADHNGEQAHRLSQATGNREPRSHQADGDRDPDAADQAQPQPAEGPSPQSHLLGVQGLHEPGGQDRNGRERRKVIMNQPGLQALQEDPGADHPAEHEDQVGMVLPPTPRRDQSGGDEGRPGIEGREAKSGSSPETRRVPPYPS